jgi:hypothetical protein
MTEPALLKYFFEYLMKSGETRLNNVKFKKNAFLP